MKKYTKKYDKHNKNTKIIKKHIKKHKNRRNKTQKYIVRKNNRVKSNTYKTIQNGGAGKISYCYMSPLIGTTSTGTSTGTSSGTSTGTSSGTPKGIIPDNIKIIIFSFKNYVIDKKIIKTNIQSALDNLVTIDELPQIPFESDEFNNEYLPYFFRVPKTKDKKDKLESKEGLSDNDKNKFYGENFVGIPDHKYTDLHYLYFYQRQNVLLDIFIINNSKITFDNIDTYVKTINSNMTGYNIVTNYEYIKKYDDIKNIILGIKKTNIPDELNEYYIPNQYVYIKPKINCENKNILELTNDRYVVKGIGLFNDVNGCYFNSVIQLIKNIKNINDIIDKSISSQTKKYEDNKTNIKEYIDTLDKIDELNLFNKLYEDKKKEKEDKSIDLQNIDVQCDFLKEFDKIDDIKNIIKQLLIYENLKIIIENKNDLILKEIKQKLRNIGFSKNIKKNNTEQQDAQELLISLNILDIFKELKVYFAKIIHAYNKEYIKSSIPDITYQLTLKFKKSVYNDINEIIYENNQAIKIDELEYYTNEINNSYNKFISLDTYFVQKENKYLLINLGLFFWDENDVSQKNNLSIKELNKNICFQEVSGINDELITEKKTGPDCNYNKTKLKVTKNDTIFNNSYENNNIIHYELISIVFHTGVNINSGHYVNASYQIDNDDNILKWIEYDDSTINIIPDINNKKSYTPYLLLYKRI